MTEALRGAENEPGAAHEARIYWEAGSGEIDWTAPHATVLMNHPIRATRYTWQSEPLTDGQTYRFVVRVATTPWPSGLKTQDTDQSVAAACSDLPVAPALSAAVI